jgi:hypothetical protein
MNECLRTFLDPGEIEARVAEQRTNWTPAQRLAYPPLQHLIDEGRRSGALIQLLVEMSQDCCNCTDPVTEEVQRFLDLDEEGPMDNPRDIADCDLGVSLPPGKPSIAYNLLLPNCPFAHSLQTGNDSCWSFLVILFEPFGGLDWRPLSQKRCSVID